VLSGNCRGFPDLYSLHSWVGLTVCIVFFIQVGIGSPYSHLLISVLTPEPWQWVIGCATFLWPGARDGVRLALVTPHRLAGIFIYFGSCPAHLFVAPARSAVV
jgi:hypothetical protein